MPASSVEVLIEVSVLMEEWATLKNANDTHVEHVLTKLAEIVERETQEFMKTDPDPFDDRHPSRSDPSSSFGHVMKAILKNDEFVMELFDSYLVTRNRPELHEVTCRLLIDLLPACEPEAVFKDQDSIRQLFAWAKTGTGPLQYYATGLLGPTMDVKDNASTFKELNNETVPIMLERLRSLAFEEESGALPPTAGEDSQVSPTKGLGLLPLLPSAAGTGSQPSPGPGGSAAGSSHASPMRLGPDNMATNMATNGGVRVSAANVAEALKLSADPGDCSNSSWSELEPLMIADYKLHPLTKRVKEEMIFHYLVPLGEYQDLLPHIYRHNALELVYRYIDFKVPQYARLSFLAMRYLASLLCHKKLSMEFVQSDGIKRLLSVPRPSMAATGTSMCLFYLGFYEEVMERACTLLGDRLTDLVAGTLWLLEYAHQSGRLHAVMFFQMTMQFKPILTLFDAKDGLRRLVNLVSVLPTVTGEPGNLGPDNLRSEDDISTDRQTIKHVWLALHRYLQAHLLFKAEAVRMQDGGRHSMQDNRVVKAALCTPDVEKENMDLLSSMFPSFHSQWEPVSSLMGLHGVELLLKTLSLCKTWPTMYRSDVMKHSLDALSICSVVPSCLRKMLSLTEPDNSTGETVVSIVLGIIEKCGYQEPEVFKSALRLMVRLVLGGRREPGSNPLRRYAVASRRLSAPASSPSALAHKVWEEMRRHNGIMILLRTLNVKGPILHADDIRALACSALVGLSMSDNLCQIMSKLPLFNTGHLQQLMRTPLHQDSRHEHAQFCLQATLLLERVCGRPQSMHMNTMDASLEHIQRADVVAQTRIVYHEQELLQLVHAHLKDQGLHKAAEALASEADLPTLPSPSEELHPHALHLFESPAPAGTPLTAEKPSGSHVATPSVGAPSLPATDQSAPMTPGVGTTGLRLKLSMSGTPCPATPSTPAQTPKLNGFQPKARAMELAGGSAALATMGAAGTADGKDSGRVSLDKIVTSYLSQQHSLCKNPVVTCPTFSLFEPHVCPPLSKYHSVDHSIVSRLAKRQFIPHINAADTAYLNRKFIYSRFRSTKVFKDTESNTCFSCCAFSPCEQWIMLGTYTGELRLYNMVGGDEAETYSCHVAPVTHCEPSRDGTLVLTSSSFGSRLSALWSMGAFFEIKTAFSDERYVEFSKQSQKNIVATKDSEARIYDVGTGQKTTTLYDSAQSNHYSLNQATFNPTDELVLSDGVLWDPFTPRPVHKFDKFNDACYTGLFHPNGLEVIINSEVWDLRTFHLLHTVPALDQCQLRFSHRGDVIYGAVLESDEDDTNIPGSNKSPYGSTFRTFDARDYSNLATIDVKRTIFDLCPDKTDTHLAVVENHKNEESMSDESLCRLYEIGRIKTVEDELEDDDDDMGGEEENDNDDDDGDAMDFLELGNEVLDEDNDGFLVDIEDGDDDDDDDDDSDDDNDSDSSITSEDSNDSDSDDGLGEDNDNVLNLLEQLINQHPDSPQ